MKVFGSYMKHKMNDKVQLASSDTEIPDDPVQSTHQPNIEVKISSNKRKLDTPVIAAGCSGLVTHRQNSSATTAGNRGVGATTGISKYAGKPTLFGASENSDQILTLLMMMMQLLLIKMRNNGFIQRKNSFLMVV